MDLITHLACPEKVAAGLAAGVLSREGGTVRDGHGQIVALLREISPSPSRACDLASGPIGNLLNFVSPALSILNLGATVGFGIAALQKLGKIDVKLDQLAVKLDRVQWVVELNYAHTLEVLRGVDTICAMMERRVLTDLEAAAELADKAQWLEPNSAHRIPRLEHALSLATQQACYLRTHVLEELPSVTGQLLDRKRINKRSRDMPPKSFNEAIVALNRFRQACLAAALKAQIEAEIGGTSAMFQARQSLQADCEKFEAALRNCALSYFRPKAFHTYDYLVHRYWLGKIAFSRVVALARRYDRDIPDGDALIELLKGNDDPDRHAAHQSPEGWHKDVMPPLGAVFELLECATADLDRLRGVANEFGLAHDSKLTLQEYREKTKVQDVPEEGHGRLVYLEVSPTPGGNTSPNFPFDENGR